MELINTMQTQQRKNDIEMMSVNAVKGVAIADGQVIASGGQIDEVDLPRTNVTSDSNQQ